MKKTRLIMPYLLITPFFVIFGVVMLYPWLWGFWVSLHKWNLLTTIEMRFIGLANYVKTLSDPVFLSALTRTLWCSVWIVTLSCAIGFFLALLTNAKIRFKNFYTALFLLPMMLTPAIVAMMWRMLLQTEWGLVNQILTGIGIRPIEWLANPSLTWLVVVVLETWLATPMAMLLFLAGLKNLPVELVEAAKVDGATYGKTILFVIIPWLKPVILMVVFFRVLYSLRIFSTTYALYAGAGPAGSGKVLGVYLYEMLRKSWELGQASAMSYVFLLITFLVALPITISIYRGMGE